jgi:hypothetical protein
MPEWAERVDVAAGRKHVLCNGRAHTYVANSDVIDGQQGLFADRDFKKGELIAVFDGRVVDAATSAYCIQVVRPNVGKVILDCENGGLPYAHKANANINTGRPKNCKITQYGSLVACRAVPKDTEFLTAYGPGYWRPARD